MLRLALLPVLAVSLSALAKDGAAHNFNQGQYSPADEKTIHDYKLTTANAGKILEAMGRMMKLGETDPTLQHKQVKAESLDDAVKQWDAVPQLKAMLKEVGLSTRDFLVGMPALGYAMAYHDAVKTHPELEVPAVASRENLKFMDAHPEIEQKWIALSSRPHP